MQVKSLDAILSIAVAIVVVVTFFDSVRNQRLLAEHKRLERKLGPLRIEDPAKMHVRGVETGEELHFAWRLYLPAGFSYQVHFGDPGYAGSTSVDAAESVSRVRFYEDEEGVLNMFTACAGFSSTRQLGNAEFADLLRDRWDEVRVDQLGADRTVIADEHEAVALLRLTLSDDLKRDLPPELDDASKKKFQSALLDLRIGSEKAFQLAKQRERSTME